MKLKTEYEPQLDGEIGRLILHELTVHARFEQAKKNMANRGG